MKNYLSNSIFLPKLLFIHQDCSSELPSFVEISAIEMSAFCEYNRTRWLELWFSKWQKILFSPEIMTC